MAMDLPGLPARLAQVRERIAGAQARGGWDHSVRIVAVTKTLGPEAVRAALDAGLTEIGENRVQEALGKMESLDGLPIAWHLVGQLQRNKARHAVGRFALIHSLDRMDLALELARRVPQGGAQPVLVQVNCSGEPQKGGVEPAALPALLDEVVTLPALSLQGLMTMAELTGDEGRQRQAFALLRRLRDEARGRGHAMSELSMGMSGDYAVAVEEGATLVRLGTVLFGERSR